ncbi:uncharacterized protein LOC112042266 isoform X2 [Lingula anatina]|uniref:Uncharacterized protein LOC112042266 isoform X2 n=1 Tax=Lingula anatina TaxID=7574 RepID=A0A2R2MQN9_LINAN|nr:uncharacterized protein LOC112042266 isoform X2 [Lingula anatina]|eukprot:XP_023932317.1 uncharacterized protein LOC112042266 isoform X2 [Lingula anatina]
MATWTVRSSGVILSVLLCGIMLIHGPLLVASELYLGYTLPSSGDYLHPIRVENFEETIRLAQLVPELKVYSCECCPEENARIRDCGLCVEQ